MIKIILSSVEPIILKSSSEKFKPNKVTKIETTIANIIYKKYCLKMFSPIGAPKVSPSSFYGIII